MPFSSIEKYKCLLWYRPMLYKHCNSELCIFFQCKDSCVSSILFIIHLSQTFFPSFFMLIEDFDKYFRKKIVWEIEIDFNTFLLYSYFLKTLSLFGQTLRLKWFLISVINPSRDQYDVDIISMTADIGSLISFTR